MRGNSFFFIAVLLAALFSIGALAQELSGKTADGCSYKVINGQYLTSCPKKDSAVAADSAPVRSASAAPVTSYGDVPVRRNYSVAPPSLPPQQPVAAPSPTAQISSSIEGSPAETAFESGDETRRTRLRNKLIDQTYAGVNVGASNMKETNAGSTTGVGLNIGTNIDETFGVELGYSYANQKLNLGLASRGANVDQQPISGVAPQRSNDSSLSTHLFTGEMQAHLTDPLKRLRPYLGAGLGWRSSTLSEEASALAGQSLSGGSLRQSALGGLFSAGTKLRVAKQLNLGFAFRYFFPLARADARLEQPVASMNGVGSPETKLSRSDDLLTGSSQYQVLGGVQYSF